MNITRYEGNPLVTPADVPPSRPDFEVICAFNAGAAVFRKETLLLLRVAERPRPEPGWVIFPVLNPETREIEVRRIAAGEPDLNLKDPRVIVYKGQGFLTSISHLRIARSRDGRNFTVDPQPAIRPQEWYETFGTEDGRVTKIGRKYYINYSGVSAVGITTGLAVTEDFTDFKRMGVIFCPDNRDVEIFPEKVNGKYACYHRPAPKHLGTPDMWLAYSPDLIHWGNHRHVISPRKDSWDSGRVGGGAPPFKTDRGWLSIYHGATPDDWYCLGALLTDLDEPHKVIARSAAPLLRPETDYEMKGFYGHVVFTCGATLAGDTIRIYYGAADTVMALAEVSISELLDDLLR